MKSKPCSSTVLSQTIYNQQGPLDSKNRTGATRCHGLKCSLCMKKQSQKCRVSKIVSCCTSSALNCTQVDPLKDPANLDSYLQISTMPHAKEVDSLMLSRYKRTQQISTRHKLQPCPTLKMSRTVTQSSISSFKSSCAAMPSSAWWSFTWTKPLSCTTTKLLRHLGSEFRSRKTSFTTCGMRTANGTKQIS